MENRISQLRRARGLSQAELAAELGVSKGAIGMYETGRRTPGIEVAKRVADYFGTTIDGLYFAASDAHTSRAG
jgi:putative transcriptional regulator